MLFILGLVQGRNTLLESGKLGLLDFGHRGREQSSCVPSFVVVCVEESFKDDGSIKQK